MRCAGAGCSWVERAVLALLMLAIPGCPSSPPTACDVLDARLVRQVVLVALWRHERASRDEAFGIDLDHEVSDGEARGCAHAADRVSPLTGEPGVDNHYATNLVPLLDMAEPRGMTALVAEQLAAGAFLYALEIVPVPGAAPRVSLLAVAATGPLAVDASSGALLAEPLLSVTTRTEGATFCLESDHLGIVVPMLALPLGERLIARPITRVQLRLVVDADGRVRTGELGAVVSLETVASVFEVVAPELAEPSLVRTLAAPDLDDDGGGECASVSLGLGIDFVPARLEAP